jgi:phenylalanyl-tRNA synthetase beta chain
MKVSYDWLQTYFKEKLPAPEKLADLFTFHTFEVEGMEKIGSDTVFDIKVLPDRANYALSHRGVAREISFITGMDIDEKRINLPEINTQQSSVLELDVRDSTMRRDSMMVIHTISNGSSPDWLKEKLEAVGQRSISLIVDITNYVLLDMGQPIHAFDLDKLVQKSGKVRLVLKPMGEEGKITILGGKDVLLDEDVLIFADGNNDDMPLDIAGIKGGAAAEIDSSTKNIIVIAANFDPSYIRKTSSRIGIKTDASKRSENTIPTELTLDGLLRAAGLIMQESPEATVEGSIDYYPTKPDSILIQTSIHEISELLGINLESSELESIFKRLDFDFTKEGDTYTISPPDYRTDLHLPSDIVEEVGRIYGYDKIPAKLPAKIDNPIPINKTAYWSERVKDILVKHGYSEIYTYSLTDKGDIEIENPLASDKHSLRSNLAQGLEKALEFNIRYADLIGINQVKIFEIGNVFTENDEHLSLGIGILNVKGRKVRKEMEEGEEVMTALSSALGVDIDKKGALQKNIFEINLTQVLAELPEPTQWDIASIESKDVTYKPISAYPFIVRDIAVFVPKDVTDREVRKVIEKNAGELMVRYSLFDEFEKGDKKSYGFRIVFQSFERTLTDKEANDSMEKITKEMNAKEGWQVR